MVLHAGLGSHTTHGRCWKRDSLTWTSLQKNPCSRPRQTFPEENKHKRNLSQGQFVVCLMVRFFQLAYRCASTSMAFGECDNCVGDVAYAAFPNFSVVVSFDKAVKASGKFGGVAGVFAGVHN